MSEKHDGRDILEIDYGPYGALNRIGTRFDTGPVTTRFYVTPKGGKLGEFDFWNRLEYGLGISIKIGGGTRLHHASRK